MSTCVDPLHEIHPFYLKGKTDLFLVVVWCNKLNGSVQNISEDYVTLFVYVLDVPMGTELGLEIHRAT